MNIQLNTKYSIPHIQCIIFLLTIFIKNLHQNFFISLKVVDVEHRITTVVPEISKITFGAYLTKKRLYTKIAILL